MKLTHKSMFLYQEWKSKFPIDHKIYSEHLKAGCVYLNGRAKVGQQPMVVFRWKRLINITKSLKVQVGFAEYICDHIIKTYMVPGKVETWISIFDMEGLTVSDFGNMAEFRKYDEEFLRNFMGRDHRMIVCNTPAVINGLWKMMYSWLDVFTQQKITVTNDVKSELLKYTDIDQIEKHYGGNKDDITSYWPELY